MTSSIKVLHRPLKLTIGTFKRIPLFILLYLLMERKKRQSFSSLELIKKLNMTSGSEKEREN